MVNYLLFSIFFLAAFPFVPVYAWILNLLIIVTFISVMGVRIALKANAVLTFVALRCMVIFIVLSIREIT